MWILLTKKIPVQGSPPKLGIFWSVPWPQIISPPKKRRATKKRSKSTKLIFDTASPFGMEPDRVGARKIRFNEYDIRVFPHEFSSLSTESLQSYINKDAVTLESSDIASDRIIEGILDGETKPIYEAALLDGCDHAQAMMVAMGQDPTLPDAQLPPIGWYKFRDEYRRVFCRDWEM